MINFFYHLTSIIPSILKASKVVFGSFLHCLSVVKIYLPAKQPQTKARPYIFDQFFRVLDYIAKYYLFLLFYPSFMFSLHFFNLNVSLHHVFSPHFISNYSSSRGSFLFPSFLLPSFLSLPHFCPLFCLVIFFPFLPVRRRIFLQSYFTASYTCPPLLLVALIPLRSTLRM